MHRLRSREPAGCSPGLLGGGLVPLAAAAPAGATPGCVDEIPPRASCTNGCDDSTPPETTLTASTAPNAAGLVTVRR